ncbi:hypothetical protein GF373_17225 [bacterium]|nr:hypothetical protein [bacterium]
MYFVIILFLSLQYANAAIVDANKAFTINYPYDINAELDIFAEDFNGDGNADLIVVDNTNKPSNIHDYQFGYFHVALTNLTKGGGIPVYNRRRFVSPQSNLNSEESVISCYKNGNRTIVGQFFETMFNLIFYAPDDYLLDREAYNLRTNHIEIASEAEIKHVLIDNFVLNNEVFIVAELEGEIQAKLFDTVCIGLKCRTIKLLATYALKTQPQNIFSGDLNQDGFSDLVFDMEREWIIWLSGQNGGFAPEQPGYAIHIPYPKNVIDTVSVIIEPNAQYPLLISCETQMESDVAFLAFGWNEVNGKIATIDWASPYHISINEKAKMGTHPFLFKYRQAEDIDYPLLLLGAPLGLHPSRQTVYYLYRIDYQNIHHPNLVQELALDPESIIPSSIFYLREPVDVADFNNDGIDDLVFKAKHISIYPNKENENQSVVGILGQKQNNACIEKGQWFLHK